jgi:prepilin-type N-terminal cleavage/methylation domain-containing protein
MKTAVHPQRSTGAFTLMEILVVIAIILVLAAIAFPVYTTIQNRANKAIALNNMRQLGAAASTYTSSHDGVLPKEDSKGTDTWSAASNPENRDAWYNSLPEGLGHRTVAQYASNPQAFYTRENLLFLPGAQYPESDKKLAQPLFAIAINTKLQRKDKDKEGASSGEKSARLSQISNPGRTVLFLEQGLPKEKKAMPQQPKYDGSPKGSAKSFVARYNNQGVLTFVDGHAELVDGEDILESNGQFRHPLQPGDIIWCKTPEENPNK